MTTKPSLSKALRNVSVVLLTTIGLHAQATRTWVSGVGDDANPCSRTAPCKTWAGAISKTAPAGEIDALDPGGFGALTITKSLILDGGGGQVASVLVSGTPGITVQAGTSDIVTIRNLQINGLKTGTHGIQFLQGQELHLDNVRINDFSGNCVNVSLNQIATVSFSIKDSAFSDCVQSGVKAENVANSVFGTIDRVTMTGMGTAGLTLDANAHVFLRDSNLSTDSTGVLLQNSGFPGNPDAVLEHNLITNNNGGVQVNAGSVRLTDNTISENGYGIAPGAGTVVSFGNNLISGNYVADGNPTSTTTLR